MLYLFDTTTFSAAMRDDPAVTRRIGQLSSDDSIITCVIVRGEVLHGIHRLPAGKRRDLLAEASERMFQDIPCAPIPVAAADQYARLKHAQQIAGLPVDENDLWIAATALVLDAVLVTRDSDFQKIQGLSIVDWTI